MQCTQLRFDYHGVHNDYTTIDVDALYELLTQALQHIPIVQVEVGVEIT
jgi:hypothetical protein